MFNSCSSGFLTSDFCWRGSNLSNKAPSLGLLFSTIAALSVACFLIVGSKTALGASCGSLITACGCTVDSPGLHTVGADLVASQGLTASGSCIDISAGGATLDLKNFSADGNGSGIGINILSGANNVVVVQSGRGIISDWGVGIEAADDRPDILFVDVESSVNSGIFLNGTTNANLWDLSSDNNGEAGVRISNGFGNHVFSSGFDRNKIGVWIDSSQRSRLDDSGYTSNNRGANQRTEP